MDKIKRKREMYRIGLLSSSIGVLLWLIGILCLPDVKITKWDDLFGAINYSLFNMNFVMLGWIGLSFIMGCVFYMSISEMKLVIRFRDKIMALEDQNEELVRNIKQFEESAHKSQSKSKELVGDRQPKK